MLEDYLGGDFLIYEDVKNGQILKIRFQLFEEFSRKISRLLCFLKVFSRLRIENLKCVAFLSFNPFLEFQEFKCAQALVDMFFQDAQVLQLISRNNNFLLASKHFPRRFISFSRICCFQMSSLYCSSPIEPYEFLRMCAVFLKTMPDFMKFKIKIIHCCLLSKMWWRMFIKCSTFWRILCSCFNDAHCVNIIS